jgi:hypothetical protein
VLELTLIGILVGFGPPRAIVILGVVAWRLVNFWLPIPVGGISYLSLRVHPPAGNPAGLAERRALWRTRWHWFIDLFEKETPSPVTARSPSIIDKVVHSDAPVAPGTPLVPDAALAPEAPLVPDTPLVPDAALAPEAPLAPGTPLVPDAALAPEAPLAPDTPPHPPSSP